MKKNIACCALSLVLLTTIVSAAAGKDNTVFAAGGDKTTRAAASDQPKQPAPDEERLHFSGFRIYYDPNNEAEMEDGVGEIAKHVKAYIEKIKSEQGFHMQPVCHFRQDSRGAVVYVYFKSGSGP
jgi:hypothetical protein